MALWQYSFFVLPKNTVLEIAPDLLFEKKDGLFDDAPYWKLGKIKRDVFNPISKILPVANSWNKDLIIFGDNESNCFEVLVDGEYVESVSFRIDFRTGYERIIEELLFFFMSAEMLVLGEDLNVLQLNGYEFKMKIENSPQYKKYKNIANQLSNEN